MKDSLNSFQWSDIGDIIKARPTLGVKMHVAVYRMFQYSFRNMLEKKYGKEEIKHILVESGKISGIEFCNNVLDSILSPDDFFNLLQQKMQEFGMGILEVKYKDFENMIFILKVSEDLDCSGVPVKDEFICNYDEGFIMGILEAYTGRHFVVKETNCWAAGDCACEFNVVSV